MNWLKLIIVPLSIFTLIEQLIYVSNVMQDLLVTSTNDFVFQSKGASLWQQCSCSLGHHRLFVLVFVPASQARMFKKYIFFLTELMVEHVSINRQFGLMISCSVVSFVVYAIVSPTCRDCDPTHVLDVNNRKFTSQFLIA